MHYTSRARALVRRLSCEEFEARLCLSGLSFASHVIDANPGTWVYAVDLDVDGDPDVLTNGGPRDDEGISWYENTDGKGTFGDRQVVFAGNIGPGELDVVDMDQDGDPDILRGFAWYENTGNGTFGQPRVIIPPPSPVMDPFAADIDGDGDMDVLGGFPWGDRIAWYENIDGQSSFGDEQVIATGTHGEQSPYPTDVDGDGDIDVLALDHSNHTILWSENTDGKGTFAPRQVITTEADGAYSGYPADVDDDGDVDLLTVSRVWGNDEKAGPRPSESIIAWYENADGRGAFGSPQVIATKAGGGVSPRSVYATDLDSDGDLDVLFGHAWSDRIVWLENTDGKGTFGKEQVITSKLEVPVEAVCAVDIDADGDVDVLSSTYRIYRKGQGWTTEGGLAWYEQFEPTAGDANLDTQFDQRDIVQVLQSGKYLTGDQADWNDGDWNGDGVFDQQDIVAALQTGNYFRSSHAAQTVDVVLAGI